MARTIENKVVTAVWGNVKAVGAELHLFCMRPVYSQD
jgi:hypothetical protein